MYVCVCVCVWVYVKHPSTTFNTSFKITQSFPFCGSLDYFGNCQIWGLLIVRFGRPPAPHQICAVADFSCSVVVELNNSKSLGFFCANVSSDIFNTWPNMDHCRCPKFVDSVIVLDILCMILLKMGCLAIGVWWENWRCQGMRIDNRRYRLNFYNVNHSSTRILWWIYFS